MSVGTLPVARKRSETPDSPEPSEEPKGARPIAIQVRGWPEWKGWVERLAAHASRKLGVPVSLNALVGLALAHYAKSLGFKEPPPER
jgi:hypothetical protein